MTFYRGYQGRRRRPPVLLDRASDTGAALEDAGATSGDVFVHQAPLPRSLEVARCACSTGTNHTGRKQKIHKIPTPDPIRLLPVWFVPRSPWGRAGAPRDLQGPRQRRLMHKHISRHAPSILRCHWAGRAGLGDASGGPGSLYKNGQKCIKMYKYQ